MDPRFIRNFSIIAHIDHGKTTLTDRLLELTHTVNSRQLSDRLLDSNPIEKERGITIKLAPVTMAFRHQNQDYQLNLIDTPGHVDFSYEVERSLAACEGAILLVDATKGIQAQTIAHLRLARRQNLTVIPVINKIDAQLAHPEAAREGLSSLFPDQDSFLEISAKTGFNINAILPKIINTIPSPQGDVSGPLRALVFNSFFHPHLGVIAFVRVVDGELTPASPLQLLPSSTVIQPKQVGIFTPALTDTGRLSTGQVGFVATGLKTINQVTVGSTLVSASADPKPALLPGYRQVKPNVYLEFYPTDTTQYPSLLDAMSKLKLNDAALSYFPVASPALGNGIRVGFLGLLHADVIRERLEREFDLAVTSTLPSVEYLVTLHSGEEISVTSATDYPDPIDIKFVQEPVTEVTLITPVDYLGALIQLLESHRGLMVNTLYHANTIELIYKVPLIEVITHLHDAVKSVSSGFSTLDYRLIGHQPIDLIKLTVNLNHQEIAPLSTLVVSQNAESTARKIASHLKNTIPRHQFEIPIQVNRGGTVIARETIKGFRKDVTAKLYGGDVTRRLKLLEKQKKGKKKMKAFGQVSVPSEAFLINLSSQADD